MAHNRPHWDYDNDQRYSNPRGWRNAKASFKKQDRLDQLFQAIEQICRNLEAGTEVPGTSRANSTIPAYDDCPRLLLAMALHHFAAAGPEGRTEMARAYWAWSQHHGDWGMNQRWDKHDSGIPCPRPWPATPPPPLVAPAPDPLPGEVSVGPYRYAVVVVEGYAKGDSGPCQCCVDHRRRRIGVSSHVPPAERPALLAEAVRIAEEQARQGGKLPEFGPVAEALPQSERTADAEFDAVMRQLFADDDRAAA